MLDGLKNATVPSIADISVAIHPIADTIAIMPHIPHGAATLVTELHGAFWNEMSDPPSATITHITDAAATLPLSTLENDEEKGAQTLLVAVRTHVEQVTAIAVALNCV
jgi:hypothetical protein